MGNWVDVSGPAAESKLQSRSKKSEKLTTSHPSSSCTFSQVRNVAEAHVLALTKTEAGGNRFIVSAGPLNGQDIGELLVFRSQRV
jgi:nucleoside-diphosphate-sugar epimerase